MPAPSPNTKFVAVSGSGSVGGTATLNATLGVFVDDGTGTNTFVLQAASGETVSFGYDLGGGFLDGGTATTDMNGMATSFPIPIPNGLAGGTFPGGVIAGFAGDAANGLDASAAVTGDLFLSADPSAPQSPPDPSQDPSNLTNDTPQTFDDATSSQGSSDFDPVTGLAPTDSYTGVPDLDPFTGQPTADPFTGQPLTGTDVAVRNFINDIFSQPPIDLTGVPQDVQDLIFDAFSRPAVDFSDIPQTVQDGIIDLYSRAENTLYSRPELDYQLPPEGEFATKILGTLLSNVFGGIANTIDTFTDVARAVNDSVGRAERAALQIWGRVGGGLQAIGGAVQVVEGVGFAIGTGVSGVGIFAGLAYAANGVDNFYTGIQRASGEQTETLLYNAVKDFAVKDLGLDETGSTKLATALDVGIPLLGGTGLAKLGALGADAKILDEVGVGLATAPERLELSESSQLLNRVANESRDLSALDLPQAIPVSPKTLGTFEQSAEAAEAVTANREAWAELTKNTSSAAPIFDVGKDVSGLSELTVLDHGAASDIAAMARGETGASSVTLSGLGQYGPNALAEELVQSGWQGGQIRLVACSTGLCNVESGLTFGEQLSAALANRGAPTIVAAPKGLVTVGSELFGTAAPVVVSPKIGVGVGAFDYFGP